ncbi:hypothetical protein [Tepidimonas sp. HKU78]|uniref:hypothetical protein n=1 Tax=Tepidimonas sp. HKU78 TaxID=3414504 RepID=UPI003CF2D644
MMAFRWWALGVALLYGGWAAARGWGIAGLEWDEAEQVLHAQRLQWGYGPQPPLMEWLVWALRQIVPVSPLVALLAIKAALLWGLAVIAAWTVAQAVRDDRWGVASGTWLLTLTPLLWDGPRSLTHSLLAATAIGAVLAAAMPLMTHPLQSMSARRWVALGLACSAALLAKYNTVLVLAALIVTWMAVLWRATGGFRNSARQGWQQHGRGLGWMVLGLMPVVPHALWLWGHRMDVAAELQTKMQGVTGRESTALEVLIAWAATAGVSVLIWVLTRAMTGRQRVATNPAASGEPPGWPRRTLAYGAAIAVLLLFLVASGALQDVQQRWILPMAVPLLVLFAVDRGHRDRGMARALTIGSLALVVLGLALLLARPVVLERLGRPSWSQLPARDIAHWADSMAGPQTVAVVQPIHVAGALALHTSAVRWVAYPGSSKLAIPTDVDACDVLWVRARAPKPGPAIATELGYRAEGALQSYRWHAASSASSGGTLYAQRWVTDARPCPSLRSVYDRLP